MGKRRSIFQQLNNAIENGFSERMDKHSYKKENGYGDSDKIFSYSGLNNMRDFARNLSNFFKQNYPEIKNLNEVKEEHLQNFLNSKNEKGCSQQTLNLYKSNLNKLENLINDRYRTCNWDFKDKIITPTSTKQYDPSRGAKNPISREDYNKILDYFRENKSTSGDAILAQNGLGFRVEELAQIKVKDVDLEKGELKFSNTKGGKEIKRDINDIKDILKRNMDGKVPEDKIFNVKSDSINVQLGRIEDKLGLDKHSNHDIRRLLAQEKYDSYREEGLSKEDALAKTSTWLNHVTPRERMLTQSYITIH